MTAPRLFPDMAAAPTPTERADARARNSRGQLGLFEPPATPRSTLRDDLDAWRAARGCAVCTSTEHDTDRCPHGTADALPI